MHFSTILLRYSIVKYFNSLLLILLYIVAVVPCGKWKLRKIAIAGNTTKLNRMIFYALEKAANIVMESGRTGKDERLVGIIDFNGFSFLEHGCFKCK